jgi:hypothetical protein
MPYVQAQSEPGGDTHQATLLLEVNAKQVGQLRRDWYAIVDVTEVRITQGVGERAQMWPAAPHVPSLAPASVEDNAHAARA